MEEDPYKNYPIVIEMSKWIGSQDKNQMCSALRIDKNSSVAQILTEINDLRTTKNEQKSN